MLRAAKVKQPLLLIEKTMTALLGTPGPSVQAQHGSLHGSALGDSSLKTPSLGISLLCSIPMFPDVIAMLRAQEKSLVLQKPSVPAEN